jgi:hypothetical protein
MLKDIKDTIGKSCLIGVSYFDLNGTKLKESLLAGKVKSVDPELGITLRLFSGKEDNKVAEFIIPTDLSCWFKAPQGNFHTSQPDVKILNPDFLVTWDIYQTKKDTADGEQQWWEWIPRTQQPKVND